MSNRGSNSVKNSKKSLAQSRLPRQTERISVRPSEMMNRRGMPYVLLRSLDKNGYILGHRKSDNFLTTIRSIYTIETDLGLRNMETKICDKKFFGHVLYLDSIKAKNDFKPIKALHVFINNSDQIETHFLDINNVIPRPQVKPNLWVSGLYIGDKNIKESLEPNYYDDKYEGGLVQIMSNHKVPSKITDPQSIKRTVGIYVNHGARVVLKTENLNINELTEDQRQILSKSDSFGHQHKPVTLLFLGGSFIWLEAVVEFRSHNSTERFCLPIEEFLRKNSDFYKVSPTKDPVPILMLNQLKSTDWGIQIKPVIEGIHNQRVVTIEAPHNWKNGLNLSFWNEFQIDSLLNRNNYPPDWSKQDSLSPSNSHSINGPIPRVIDLEMAKVDPQSNDVIGKLRSFPNDRFTIYSNEIYMYSIRRDKKFIVLATLEQHSDRQPIAVFGSVFVLEHSDQLDQLVFSLKQQKRFGTFLYLAKDKDSDSLEKYSTLHAFICSKNDETYNWNPIAIKDVLWKTFEDDVWLRGLVIGGIDVIRKKPLKVLRGERKTSKKSKGLSAEDLEKGLGEKEDSHNETKKIDSYEKQMSAYKIRPSAPKKPRKNIALRLIETPKVIEDWNYCQEIRTDYIIPQKKTELPFEGKIIGIYIPECVRCVLINGIVDKAKLDRPRNIHQTLDKDKLHPILLQEKTFLWIEGIVEMNLLEDTELCYQPLEHSILKQLIIDDYIIGDTDGVEYPHDLYGKVLFLNKTKDQSIIWSIEVSPLVYPTYEKRVVYVNIPESGRIQIKDWDKAFEDTINWADTQVDARISKNPDESQTKKFSYYPLKRWLDRDFKQQIYDFLNQCIADKILIEIPSNYRKSATNTKEAILKGAMSLYKNYADVFLLFENKSEPDKYWFFIRYRNFYMDHYGLMKFIESKISLFEIHFKQHFYQQLI